MVLRGIDARNRDVGFVYRLDIQVRRTWEPPIFLAVPIFLGIPPMSPPAHLGARLSFRFLRKKQRDSGKFHTLGGWGSSRP